MNCKASSERREWKAVPCWAGVQLETRDIAETAGKKCTLSLCTKLEIFFWFRFLATAAAVTTVPVPSPRPPLQFLPFFW